jgi:hypothetical protein
VTNLDGLEGRGGLPAAGELEHGGGVEGGREDRELWCNQGSAKRY